MQEADDRAEIDELAEKYDTQEAMRLLGDRAEQMAPRLNAAGNAGQALLKALAGLTQTGIVIGPLRGSAYDTLIIGVGRTAGVLLSHDGMGRFQIADEDKPGEWSPITGLRFNQASGLLEGEELSSEIVPVPGELRPRKSAVAVVVEQVCARLKSLHEQGRRAGRQ